MSGYTKMDENQPPPPPYNPYQAPPAPVYHQPAPNLHQHTSVQMPATPIIISSGHAPGNKGCCCCCCTCPFWVCGLFMALFVIALIIIASTIH